jgi:hypothetical protein
MVARPLFHQCLWFTKRHPFVVSIGWIAPAIWAIIAITIALGARAILISSEPEWRKTLEIVFYGWLIFKVLTKI